MHQIDRITSHNTSHDKSQGKTGSGNDFHWSWGQCVSGRSDARSTSVKLGVGGLHPKPCSLATMPLGTYPVGCVDVGVDNG